MYKRKDDTNDDDYDGDEIGDGFHGYNTGRWFPWLQHWEVVAMVIILGDGCHGYNTGRYFICFFFSNLLGE